MINLLFLGFLLGIQHALDPDHIFAVSTLVSRHHRPAKTVLIGAFWGLGHTTTLLLVGIIVVAFKLTISPALASGFEFLVGVLLVIIGLRTLITATAPIHIHTHSHDQPHHSHHLSFAIGLVHGLAGSAALMLLVLGTVRSLFSAITYILIFSFGSLLGMATLSLVLGLALSAASRWLAPVSKWLHILTGSLAAAFGIILMYQIAFR